MPAAHAGNPGGGILRARERTVRPRADPRFWVLGEAATGAPVQSGELLLTAPDRRRDGFRLSLIHARGRQGAGIFERVKCSGHQGASLALRGNTAAHRASGRRQQRTCPTGSGTSPPDCTGTIDRLGARPHCRRRHPGRTRLLCGAPTSPDETGAGDGHETNLSRVRHGGAGALSAAHCNASLDA